MTTSSLNRTRPVDASSQTVIDYRDLVFAGAWLRENAHQEVIKAFKESGLSQADLAKRLGRNRGWLSRTLGASGNWTLDTVGQLLFAIDGSMAGVVRERPQDMAASNRRAPVFDDRTHHQSVSASPIVANVVIHSHWREEPVGSVVHANAV